MPDPKFYLRAGEAGELVKGTAGHVLTLQADGTVQGEPAASIPPLPSAERVLSVSKGGSDVTGDGTPEKPFATIPAAMASILDATTAKRYAVAIGPGTYSEDFALKPNVWIVGLSPNLCRIDAVSVTLGPAWNDPGVNNRAGFARCQFRAPYVFDLAAAGSDAGYLTFETFSSTGSLELRGTDNNAWFLQTCQLYAGLKQHGGFAIYQAVFVTNSGEWVIEDAGVGSDTEVQIANCACDVLASVTAVAGAVIGFEVLASFFIAATLDGAGVGSNCSAGAIRTLSLLNGAASPRPVVTGSRGGNAALTSALTGLAAAGVLTNSSSA